ncbi:MAG: sigma 54-interacting transcriptional regulator [Verrucomicrobiota bacterium]
MERSAHSWEERIAAIIEVLDPFEAEVGRQIAADTLPTRFKEPAAYSCLSRLYHETIVDLDKIVEAGGTQSAVNRRVFRKFSEKFAPRKTVISAAEESAWLEPAHLFACFFQLRRAFNQIERSVTGHAKPVQDLRGRIWESIFTRDMKRFQLWMFQAVGRFPTLVLGPSGSGKELVSRAIGQSRFLSYDSGSALFSNETQPTFYPVNLSALSPTILESELFGHVRGSFTGAHTDRKGLFETAGDSGCVFLDEIGDVGQDLQVKLLRLLQSGEFQRIGESRTQSFGGKVIAATNRDLGAEMKAGRFREDLFYRLCGDQVRTPSLHSILLDEPDDLERFVYFVCRNLFGESASATVAPEISESLRDQIPDGYGWPGNFRELEQAIRNIVVTGRYEIGDPSEAPEITRLYQSAEIPLSDWVGLYARRAREVHRTTRKAADILGVDPRTLQKHYN